MWSMMPKELLDSKAPQWQTHAIHTSGLPVSLVSLPSSRGCWGFVSSSQWVSGPLSVGAVESWCSFSEAGKNTSHITYKFSKKRKYIVKSSEWCMGTSLTFLLKVQSQQKPNRPSEMEKNNCHISNCQPFKIQTFWGCTQCVKNCRL